MVIVGGFCNVKWAGTSTAIVRLVEDEDLPVRA